MHLASIDEITSDYRSIYLQPHFDDAALSCGGTIALQTATGQRVLVVTVFAGMPKDNVVSPFAAQQLQRMGFGADPRTAMQQRREEDAAALGALGANTLWLDFLDAILRGTPPFYAAEETLFGSVHPSDLSIDEQLATMLHTMHQRAPLAVFYAPMGIGHHVDHQLVCSAADRLVQQHVTVKFYEDFPYVTKPGALVARQKELGSPMEPELVEVSGLLRAKEEAVGKYGSQVPMLFGTEDRMRQWLRDYSSSLRRAYPGIQVERYWRW